MKLDVYVQGKVAWGNRTPRNSCPFRGIDRERWLLGYDTAAEQSLIKLKTSASDETLPIDPGTIREPRS